MKTKLISTSLLLLASMTANHAAVASNLDKTDNVVTSKYSFELINNIYKKKETYYTIIPNYSDGAFPDNTSSQTVICNGVNVGMGLNINVPAGSPLSCQVTNTSNTTPYLFFPELKIRWVMKNVPYGVYLSGTYTSSLTFVDLPLPPYNNDVNLGTLTESQCGGTDHDRNNFLLQYGTCNYYPTN